jgi:K+-sensing histidine kinase KdpD
MAQSIEQQSAEQTLEGKPERRTSEMSLTGRPILLLRGLALLLVLILHWFDRSTAGVIFAVPQMVLVLLGYSGLLVLLTRYVRWLRRPLNSLALDTVLATLCVYLTGGYHSSFFVLYVFIIIGVAFQLELARTVVVGLAIGLIYVGACYVNPAGLQSPYAQYILAAKVLLLLMVAVLCGLLLEQLRREHHDTEYERALAQRLRALNDLFQRLNTTLDLPLTLQMVAEAPRTLLGADWTSIALVDQTGQSLTVVAASGIEMSPLTTKRWSADDVAISAVLASDQPSVFDGSVEPLQTLPVVLAGRQAHLNIASVVAMPLSLNGEPLGLLGVAYRNPQTFTQENLDFLHALGQEAALAIRNARLYERERTQVARLRALDELQRTFVSSVSHELRTPLTCIRASVELLGAMSEDLPSDQAELVHTIEHHTSRLEGLVSDLLEITKLEAGQVTLSKQPTDLCALVNRAVDTLRPLSTRKQQTIYLHMATACAPLEVDRGRIEQVLTNILSNAIKFAPKQSEIAVQLSESDGRLRVCIADRGPGIPEEDRARIFDKFYVVADGRGLSGLGLGLYIAREMIELHGGRIWVESQPDQGSTFCFELPRERWTP